MVLDVVVKFEGDRCVEAAYNTTGCYIVLSRPKQLGNTARRAGMEQEAISESETHYDSVSFTQVWRHSGDPTQNCRWKLNRPSELIDGRESTCETYPQRKRAQESVN